MTTLLQLSLLAVLAGATVMAVRLLILRGLDVVADRLELSSKTQGQLLGYATSMPELVVVISAAWAGVFDAGFWNIASSNIINWVLFLCALFFYRQYRDLKKRAFFDEILFGLLSVALPLVLQKMHVPLSLATALSLIVLFAFYKVIDRWANASQSKEERPHVQQSSHGYSLSFGIVLLVAGIVIIAICGNLIGKTASELINIVGIPAWMVGWILGFVTSLPEMSSFFGIYALHKKREMLALTEDTQECLDALVASNMSNLGVILPIGVLVLTLL